MGDEVVLARYDLTVPGQVSEHGIIHLDSGESGFDRLQDGFLGCFIVSEAADVLGGELALGGTE